MKNQKLLKLASTLFIVAGLIAIAFAIVTICQDVNYVVGSYTWYETYGGDAYTGIQNAAADTATNVYYLNHNLEDFAVMFKLSTFATLLVAGFVSIGYGIKCLIPNEIKEETTEIKGE